MDKLAFKLSTLLLICLIGRDCSSKANFTVSSPDGQITAILKFDDEQGAV